MKTLTTFALLASLGWSTISACDYVSKMIECDSTSEGSISALYETYLELLTKKEIKRERLKFPESVTSQKNGRVILSRSYYVTPNELRGFELVIPIELIERKNGYIISNCDLEVDSIESKQGIQILLLKEENSNKAVDTTAANARLFHIETSKSTNSDVVAMTESAVVSP